MFVALLFFLSIGPRQIFDEDMDGLRYEDESNDWNKGRQFLNDETIIEDEPECGELYNPPEPFPYELNDKT